MTIENILIIFFLGVFVGASLTIWLLVNDKEEKR